MERKIYNKLLIVSIISLILVTIGLSYLFYDIYLDLKEEKLLQSTSLVLENPEIDLDRFESIDFDIYKKEDPPKEKPGNIYLDKELNSEDNIRVYESIESINYIFIASAPIIVGLLVLIIILLHLISSYLTREIMEPIEKASGIMDGSLTREEIESDAIYPELRVFLDKIQFYKESSDIHIDRLKENENFRREFTANVSHELKTPLTSINGYAEIIKSGLAKDEDIPGLAAIIHEEGSRLLELINSIINLSSLDDPKLDLEFEKLQLEEIILDSLNLLMPEIEKKGLKINCNLEEATILGDKRMIEDLFFNLLDNAIKYNIDKGEIFISFKKESKKLIIIIEDTGIGISQEDLEHIFERFYMVDKSRSSKNKGTGLGLSIVKHILQIHQANISISSELNKGSRVILSFDSLE